MTQTISEQAAEGVVWAVIDWASLRSVDRVLTAPVWGKATKGRTAEGWPLLPALAARLGPATGTG